jgi:hypothetical protein
VPDVGSWAGRKSGASIVKHTQEDMKWRRSIRFVFFL